MIVNKKDIAILLATYNGSKYLRVQLDSIIGQSVDNWALFVRDDCSTDDTFSILKEYSIMYDNIYIVDNDNINLGAANNFMYLLREVDSKYYMFADQDDVWLSNKIEKTYLELKRIEDKNKDNAILVYTDIMVTDAELNIIYPSFWKSINHKPYLFNNLLSFVYVQYIPGCTMMFNKKVRDLALLEDKYVNLHDYWLSICTYKNDGIVSYVKEPQMLYRRHENNVTEDLSVSQSSKTFLCRLKELITVYNEVKRIGVVNNLFEFLYYKYKFKYLRNK